MLKLLAEGLLISFKRICDFIVKTLHLHLVFLYSVSELHVLELNLRIQGLILKLQIIPWFVTVSSDRKLAFLRIAAR